MEISFTPNDRGQVGIGTLIVFIAMVLVAAIAAGVLINTAGFLQTQAEDTGTESTEQVANNLNIITEVGEVNDTGSGQGTIDGLEVGLQPAAGSDDLNLEELSIQYVADESFSNLVHIKEVSANDDNEIVGEDTVFNTEPVTAEDGEDNVMTDNADRYDLIIPLEDERPFVQTEEISDVNEQDNSEVLKVDIVINTNGGDITDEGDLATELEEVDQEELTEVEVVEDDPADVDTVLYEADTTADFDFSEDANDFEDEGTVNSDAMERYVVYIDEVDAEQLNGFDDELGNDGAIAPAFFDGLSNDNLEELVEGEEAELTFTTETGAQTVAILQVPDSLAGEDDGDAVDL